MSSSSSASEAWASAQSWAQKCKGKHLPPNPPLQHNRLTRSPSCRTIIGVDRIESRLKLASELGATHTIDGSKLGDKTLVEAIREVADGIGPTIAVDTTGAPPLIKAGIEAIRNKGRYIQVGSAPFDFQCEFNMFTFMVAGKSVQGAIEGEAYPAEFVPQMIKWYREGRFPIDKLTKFMPAEDFEQALKEM
ncbi:hypothetical protein LTR35_003732 [Friedmanniomyces endolithicus]|nr:hypothetical protein LTR35_003732 [Friedmanniomyces endolithicus]